MPMTTKTIFNKTYFKIASIISSSFKGSYTHPWHGAYYHDTNGKLVATDGRRIVIFHNEEKIAESRYMTEDGTLLSKNYPNYEHYLNEKLEITGEWIIDLGELIKHNGWMDLKKVGIKNVIFTSKYIHYRKGTECIVNEEDVTLNMIDAKFIADVLRCYRTYNHNRTNNMMVKIKFTRKNGTDTSPCHIETIDGSMTYIVMPKSFPIIPKLNLNNTEATVIELEKKNIF